MNRKRIVKIVKKLVCGLILVVYLTTSGIVLWSKIVRASTANNSKYTITNKYAMTEDEVNLLATKSVFYVIFTASEDKKLAYSSLNMERSKKF
ncbi:hypothetical protein [Clostridium sp. CF012]|uniref:hypothetical protein n=1 Tax=Clostridium sp. CF012 TaxID=2843319 RepID=UPI001C0E6689|nr:hypothetical protein [Clostridium sp. CF012]MBU3145992.1 hypothetical protein [Clostridium sp. CF012]